jgi:shikimate kinase
MIVFSLVGPSACGKTTLLNELSKNNYCTMKVEYMGTYHRRLNNKEVLSKWNWVSCWFEKILDLSEKEINLLFTDRYPMEVVPYANRGVSLVKPILHSLEELKFHNIFVKTIYLKLSFDELMKRVYSRISSEPVRRVYSEIDEVFSKNVFQYYENELAEMWTYVIDSNGKNTAAIMNEIIELTGKDRNNE